MRWYIGIDEAGRGCVVGPLVVATVAIPEPVMAYIKGRGIADSKKLSPLVRISMSNDIKQYCAYELREIPVSQIDTAVQRHNLNGLESSYAHE